MRVTKREISAKDGEGSVKITAEVPEDVWHVYNMLQATDVVTAGTTRKVSCPTWHLRRRRAPSSPARAPWRSRGKGPCDC